MSGIVVIWLEIQLAYALAASTLSASKSFTESFNSGFGLGFARGKGEDSYGLSNISDRTPSSSKIEKSRNDSALESGIIASRTRSQTPGYSSKADKDLVNSTVTPISQHNSISDLGLKLRPETGTKTSTYVSAERELGPCQENSSSESESFADDMVIVRETGYEVQHDHAPILRMR